MRINVEIKKVESLSKKYVDFIRKQRKREYGDGSLNPKKDDKGGIYFFVKDEGNIVAFGMLKPIKIKYLGKKYKIFGKGRGIAVKKGREYGRILNAVQICYLKKTGMTAVAFTSIKNLGFFEKVGFKTYKDGIRRFQYKNPKTGKIEIDLDGQAIYFEGKDKFMSKLISTKGIAFTDTDFW